MEFTILSTHFLRIPLSKWNCDFSVNINGENTNYRSFACGKEDVYPASQHRWSASNIWQRTGQNKRKVLAKSSAPKSVFLRCILRNPFWIVWNWSIIPYNQRNGTGLENTCISHNYCFRRDLQSDSCNELGLWEFTIRDYWFGKDPKRL